jgi:hypothetical protein
VAFGAVVEITPSIEVVGSVSSAILFLSEERPQMNVEGRLYLVLLSSFGHLQS